MNELPRDEWIIGEGLDSAARWYVIHARDPLFVLEVCDDDEVPIILPGGVTWRLSNGQIGCNMVWMGEELPAAAELDHWIGQIGDVLDDYDTRAERRLDRARRADEEDE